MEVQGHRGCRGRTPENSLLGFLTAIEAGADALELDLLATRDGVVVVHHNYSVNKKLCVRIDGKPIDGEPLIRSLTLDELKQLDCGGKKNEHFTRQVPQKGTLIPTLSELLDLIHHCKHPNGKKVRLNLEIKRDSRHPEYTFAPHEFAKMVVEVVDRASFSERVYYSSFDSESLAAIRAVKPIAKLGFIFDEETLPGDTLKMAVEIAASVDAMVVSPHHVLLKNRDDLAILRGFRVIPWTVNEPERWAQLIDLSVDGIITDYPEELIDFLKQDKQ